MGAVAQGAEQGELVAAGKRGEFLGVEAGGAQEVEGGRGLFLEAGEVLAEAVRRGETYRGETGFDGRRRRARRAGEGGAEGVRGVRREHEGAGSAAGGGQGRGRGGGGPAGAAGAGYQNGAHGV